MNDMDSKYQGQVPEFYHRYLGPVMFAPYAADLCNRVTVPPSGSLLEIACGTGQLTRQLRDKLPATVSIVATDLNEAMAEQARLHWDKSDTVVWQQADATTLPFADHSFDAVACQCGVMFFPDKPRALREVRRVLRPSGPFAFNVWGTLQENPFARVAQETVEHFVTHDAPQFFHVPFGFSDAEVLRSWLSETGFDRIESERVKMRARSASARSFALGLIRGYPVSFALQERGVPVDEVVDALSAKLAAVGGAEPFESEMCALVMTARRAN